MKKASWIIFPLLLFFMIGQNGCLAAPSSTQSGTGPSITTSPISGPTKPVDFQSRPDAASGVLRLWWSKRQTLNPLLDLSKSGQDINDLLYQSLFTMDASQKSQPQLVKEMTCSSDGLQVMISLQPDILFSNGQPLIAADVVACINFILAHAGQSSFAAAMKSISSASVVDSQNLQLVLNQKDPWLAYSLTFPIIPAKSLSEDPFALVPGSGPFFMVSYENQKKLVMQKKAPSGTLSELKTIWLLEYDNLSAAMQAFENDEIDLVNLAASDYSRYLLSNSMRFEQYTGDQMLFLAYNTQKRKLLSDNNRLLYLKQLLNFEAAANLSGKLCGENATVPLSAASWILDNATTDTKAELLQLGKPTWEKTGKKLRILLPQDDSYQKEAMTVITSQLDAAGIAWQQETLAKTAYWAALQAGDYDLTLLDAVIPAKPNPTWIYRDDRPASYALLASMSNGGLADYDLWRQRLVDSVSVGNGSLLPYGQDFADILVKTAARSPWSVLLIRQAALLYGNRVVGQCQPNQYHPYRGIEELWIWSGQSS